MRRALAAALALALGVPAGAGADDAGPRVFTQIAQPPCALCHRLKAAGAAGTLGPSLDEIQPDKARVLEAVRKGIGPMPPYAEKLAPEQIEAVAEFVARAAGR